MFHSKYNILAVIFDLDGVLINSEKISLKAWYEGGKKTGIKISKEILIKTIGHPVEQRIEIIQNEIGMIKNKIKFLRQTEKIYNSLLFKKSNLLKKGVIELLTYLCEKKILIGLSTSSKLSTTENLLNFYNIYKFFNVIVTSDHVSNNKPHPELYLKCLEKLKINRLNIFAIEDSESGSLSALSAGIRTILIPDIAIIPNDLKNRYEFIFSDLIEFLTFLKSSTQI